MMKKEKHLIASLCSTIIELFSENAQECNIDYDTYYPAILYNFPISVDLPNNPLFAQSLENFSELLIEFVDSEVPKSTFSSSDLLLIMKTNYIAFILGNAMLLHGKVFQWINMLLQAALKDENMNKQDELLIWWHHLAVMGIIQRSRKRLESEVDEWCTGNIAFLSGLLSCHSMNTALFHKRESKPSQNVEKCLFSRLFPYKTVCLSALLRILSVLLSDSTGDISSEVLSVNASRTALENWWVRTVTLSSHVNKFRLLLSLLQTIQIVLYCDDFSSKVSDMSWEALMERNTCDVYDTSNPCCDYAITKARSGLQNGFPRLLNPNAIKPAVSITFSVKVFEHLGDLLRGIMLMGYGRCCNGAAVTYTPFVESEQNLALVVYASACSALSALVFSQSWIVLKATNQHDAALCNSGGKLKDRDAGLADEVEAEVVGDIMTSALDEHSNPLCMQKWIQSVFQAVYIMINDKSQSKSNSVSLNRCIFGFLANLTTLSADYFEQRQYWSLYLREGHGRSIDKQCGDLINSLLPGHRITKYPEFSGVLFRALFGHSDSIVNRNAGLIIRNCLVGLHLKSAVFQDCLESMDVSNKSKPQRSIQNDALLDILSRVMKCVYLLLHGELNDGLVEILLEITVAWFAIAPLKRFQNSVESYQLFHAVSQRQNLAYSLNSGGVLADIQIIAYKTISFLAEMCLSHNSSARLYCKALYVIISDSMDIHKSYSLTVIQKINGQTRADRGALSDVGGLVCVYTGLSCTEICSKCGVNQSFCRLLPSKIESLMVQENNCDILQDFKALFNLLIAKYSVVCVMKRSENSILEAIEFVFELSKRHIFSVKWQAGRATTDHDIIYFGTAIINYLSILLSLFPSPDAVTVSYEGEVKKVMDVLFHIILISIQYKKNSLRCAAISVLGDIKGNVWMWLKSSKNHSYPVFVTAILTHNLYFDQPMGQIRSLVFKSLGDLLIDLCEVNCNDGIWKDTSDFSLSSVAPLRLWFGYLVLFRQYNGTRNVLENSHSEGIFTLDELLESCVNRFEVRNKIIGENFRSLFGCVSENKDPEIALKMKEFHECIRNVLAWWQSILSPEADMITWFYVLLNELILGLFDSKLEVRVTAAWAVGNFLQLCGNTLANIEDKVLLSMDTSARTIIYPIQQRLLQSIGGIMLLLLRKDSDKLSLSLTRTLGMLCLNWGKACEKLPLCERLTIMLSENESMSVVGLLQVDAYISALWIKIVSGHQAGVREEVLIDAKSFTIYLQIFRNKLTQNIPIKMMLTYIRTIGMYAVMFTGMLKWINVDKISLLARIHSISMKLLIICTSFTRYAPSLEVRELACLALENLLSGYFACCNKAHSSGLVITYPALLGDILLFALEHCSKNIVRWTSGISRNEQVNIVGAMNQHLGGSKNEKSKDIISDYALLTMNLMRCLYRAVHQFLHVEECNIQSSFQSKCVNILLFYADDVVSWIEHVVDSITTRKMACSPVALDHCFLFPIGQLKKQVSKYVYLWRCDKSFAQMCGSELCEQFLSIIGSNIDDDEGFDNFQHIQRSQWGESEQDHGLLPSTYSKCLWIVAGGKILRSANDQIARRSNALNNTDEEM